MFCFLSGRNVSWGKANYESLFSLFFFFLLAQGTRIIYARKESWSGWWLFEEFISMFMICILISLGNSVSDFVLPVEYLAQGVALLSPTTTTQIWVARFTHLALLIWVHSWTLYFQASSNVLDFYELSLPFCKVHFVCIYFIKIK